VKYDSEELKQCLASFISKHVSENFKSKNFFKYPPKRYRISVQFTIDTKGRTTNVLARAPHADMEKEAIRVVRNLPKINPGIVEGKPVNVLYGLPINFIVPEKDKKAKN